MNLFSEKIKDQHTELKILVRSGENRDKWKEKDVAADGWFTARQDRSFALL